MATPGAPLVVVVEQYTGWHLLLYLLPPRWAARIVARALLRGAWAGASFAPGAAPLQVVLPGGATFRVTDSSGRVAADALALNQLPP